MSMEMSRQEYWSGFPFPSPGDLPNPGIERMCPTLQADSLPAELLGNLSQGVLKYLAWDMSNQIVPKTLKRAERL